jgi:hypothetical protein
MNTMAYYGLLPDAEVVLSQKDAARLTAVKTGQNAPAGLPATQAGQMEARVESARTAPTKTAPVRPIPAGQAQSAPLVHDSSLVPAVVGMGLRNAVELFAGRGVVPEVKGKGGIVGRQIPEAGSPWPATGKACVLWMEEDS